MKCISQLCNIYEIITGMFQTFAAGLLDTRCFGDIRCNIGSRIGYHICARSSDSYSKPARLGAEGSTMNKGPDKGPARPTLPWQYTSPCRY